MVILIFKIRQNFGWWGSYQLINVQFSILAWHNSMRNFLRLLYAVIALKRYLNPLWNKSFWLIYSHIMASIPSVPNNFQRGSWTRKSSYLVHYYFSGGGWQILHLLNIPFEISLSSWQFSPALDDFILTLSSLWLIIRKHFI